MTEQERIALIKKMCDERRERRLPKILTSTRDDLEDELSRLSHYTQSNPRERVSIDGDE